MPEGNDVHKFYDSIKSIKGKTILKGPKVTKVYPKGKVLFVELSNDKAIVMRFGMSGYVVLSKDPPPYTKKTIKFEKGKPLHYVSVRKLGSFKKMSITKAHNIRDSLGPDPLLEDVRPVLDSGSRSGAKLGSLLMDQKFLSGIGNRLRSQILWEARLSPHDTLGDLTSKQKDTLATKIHDVMKYRPYAGDVYRRTRDSKGNPVLKETIGGRTMWWSPNRVDRST